MQLKDPRPYVFLAHIQWLDESNTDPHLTLQNGEKTKFPPHLSSATVVTFKVGSEAVRNLYITEEGVSFSTRFSGKEFTVYAPLDCMLLLSSANGQVRIPLQNFSAAPDQKIEPKEPMSEEAVLERPPVKKPVLSLVPKSEVPDGFTPSPRSAPKLSLVPKTKPVFDEPPEPERA